MRTRGRARRSIWGALAAAFLAMVLLVGLAGAAGAQTYPNPEPPGDPGDPTEVLGTKFVRADPNDPGLPLTGGDVIGLTVIGLGLVATGTIVLRTRRHVAA